jgi:hypothetical protein
VFSYVAALVGEGWGRCNGLHPGEGPVQATRRKQKTRNGAPAPHHTQLYIERCCTTVSGRNHCSSLLW